MKRNLSYLLIACILISSIFTMTGFAESETLTPFVENDFIGMTDLERGIAKMQIMGFSDQFINDLSENEIVTKYADAVSYTATDSYYKEVPNMLAFSTTDNSNVGSSLIEITEEEFNAMPVSSELPHIAVEGGIQPYAENTTTYGLLKLTMGATHQGGGNYYFYARYEWTSPPSYRAKDVFGISKDSNTATNSSTFYSVTKYREKKYQIYMGAGGATTSLLTDYEYWDERYSNGWDHYGPGGYAVEANLPNDYWPVQMVVGTFATGYLYSEFRGYMSYDGSVTYPSSSANFNLFNTYAHQTGGYLWGFSVSIPGGAAISVSPQAQYDTKIRDILVQYRP
jgi:hypothetical protein